MEQAADPFTVPSSRWRLHHVGIALPNLEAAAEPWRVMGLALIGEETVERQGVRVRMLAAGESGIELLCPTHEGSPIARHLAKRGPGLHHVAFGVANIASELTRLAAAGARLIDETPRPGFQGHEVAFVHPVWAGGVLVELVQTG